MVVVPAFYLRRLGDPQRRREIEGREVTAVSALREGVPARIRGVVVAREPLLMSKIGGQTCVGYRASIFESFGDASGRERERVWSGEGWSSFLLMDETGTVAVEGSFQMVFDPDGGALDSRRSGTRCWPKMGYG